MNDDDKSKTSEISETSKTSKAMSADELEKKCEEYLNGWKRAQADYQNLVKEFDGRRNDYVRFANVNLIIDLLPILDNFKSAFNQIPEVEKNSPWVTGFSYIKKQLEDFLAREGVESIKTVGETFNHEEHEAVDNEGEGEDGDEGNDDATADKQGDKNEDSAVKQVVTKEVRPGYKLNNKIVQVAKVVVAKK
ncbi:MAG: nucleotide exchange factor GrpE [Patescibacteria group bacterium]